MDNNNFDVFNQYLDAQKNMMNMWTQLSSNFMPQGAQMPGMGAMQGMMPFNNPMEYYKTLTDTLNNAYTNYTGSPTQLLEKINQGSEAYYNLYKLWEDIYDKNIEPTAENMKSVVDEMKNKYNEFYSQYMLPYLPQEVQGTVKQSIGLTESAQAAAEDFWGPWANSMKELNDSYMKGLYKDPEAFLEYFDQWKKNYEESFGKLLNVPAMGISRETTEKQLQTFDKYIKLMTYLTEVTIKVNNLITESTESIIVDSFTAIQNGEQPKTYEEFYQAWRKRVNAAFDELLYSDEFSKLLGSFTNSVMEFKINLDKVMENNLDFLPVVKNSEIDSLYKTVYELKREVRRLSKKVAAYEEGNEKNKATKDTKEVKETKDAKQGVDATRSTRMTGTAADTKK